MHIQSIGRKTSIQDKYKTMIGILYSQNYGVGSDFEVF